MKKILLIMTLVSLLMANVKVVAQTITVDYSQYSTAIAELEEQTDIINNLISECQAKGISPDYEIMRSAVLNRYVKQLKDELLNGVSYRSEENGYSEADVKHIYDYTIKSLNDIAREATENLSAYQTGGKEALSVPKILTSETEINGREVTALTELDGVTERRKIFLNGYGHYITHEDFDFFNDTGTSLIQTEIGISAYCNIANGITDWITGYNLKPDAVIELSDEESRSGNMSVKMTNTTPKTDKYYMNITQPVKVEPDTNYTYSFWVKGEDISYFSYKTTVSDTYRWIGYNTSLDIADWKKYEVTFRTGVEQTTERVYLSTQGVTSAIYIDDVSLCKEGTDINLLSNSSFESADPVDKLLDADYEKLWELEEMLKKAEEKNIKIDLLLSPHYFLWSLCDIYPDLREQGDSIGFALAHEAAKKACVFHAQTIAELVKDCGSVNSICIANEPKNNAKYNGNDGYYRAAYTAYLKNIYQRVENYNDEFDTAYSDFSEIPYPQYASSEDSVLAYDYCLFNDSIMTEWINLMSDTIKSVTDKPVHVKAMSYVSWADDSDNRWLMAIGVDPQEYSDYVDINGNDSDLRIPTGYTGSVSELMKSRALQQSMLYDFLLSIKDAPVFNSEDHIIANGDKLYRDEHNKLINAAHWMGAVHGRTMTATWTWNNSLTRPETYESIIYRPDIIENISEMNMDLNRLSNEVYAVMEKPRDVCILYSETSRHYNRRHMNTVYKAYENCLYNGLTPGFIVESQLDNIDKYKLIIVPYATNVKKGVVDKLKAFKENGGSVIVIGDGCLKYDERKSAHNKADVAYITEKNIELAHSDVNTWEISMSEDELFTAIKSEAEKLGLIDIVIIDNSTGEPVRDVEYKAAQYNGKTLISICNYDWNTDKNISIYKNEKLIASAKELRSAEALTAEIELKSYTPILIETENDMNAISDINVSETEVTCTVKTDTEIRNAVLAAAIYDDDGVLNTVKLTDIESHIGEKVYSSPVNTAGKRIKLMLIDKETLKPYMKAAEVSEVVE